MRRENKAAGELLERECVAKKKKRKKRNILRFLSRLLRGCLEDLECEGRLFLPDFSARCACVVVVVLSTPTAMVVEPGLD